jgi:hypothetical protein
MVKVRPDRQAVKAFLGRILGTIIHYISKRYCEYIENFYGMTAACAGKGLRRTATQYLVPGVTRSGPARPGRPGLEMPAGAPI